MTFQYYTEEVKALDALLPLILRDGPRDKMSIMYELAHRTRRQTDKSKAENDYEKPVVRVQAITSYVNEMIESGLLINTSDDKYTLI